MSAHSTLHVSIDAPERLPGLPAAVEVAAYRLVQEALTNVERHAQAQHTRVRLWLGGVDGDTAIDCAVEDTAGVSDRHRDARPPVAVSALAPAAPRLGMVTLANRWLWVEVADDGIGLPPVGQRRAGVGVLAMRERAEELGGHCSITDRAEAAASDAARDATNDATSAATNDATSAGSDHGPHGVCVLAAFPLTAAEPRRGAARTPAGADTGRDAVFVAGPTQADTTASRVASARRRPEQAQQAQQARREDHA